MINRIKQLLWVFLFIFTLAGIGNSIISYAIIPNQYEEKIYTHAEVKEIASKERAHGIKLAGDNQMAVVKWFFLPIFILLVLLAFTYRVEHKKTNK